MKITFYGAAQVVTGSCYLVESQEFKILIDCGMFQGSKKLKELNYGDFPFNPSSIDAMILTHAHIDHSGLIPKLIKHGFTGTIWSTPETKELCSVLLPDSGHIQEMEVERKNRKLKRAGQSLITPIYTSIDGQNAITLFKSVHYLEKTELNSNISFRFLDAGHILGSAHVVLYIEEQGIQKKIIFSGDIGSSNQPYIEDPTLINDGDIVVMETTYGGKTHSDKGNRLEQLAETIKSTYERGGNLIIPAFAVERTQDLLYYIHQLQLNRKIPIMPIYIDSPLAVQTTKIFEQNSLNFDKETSLLIEKGENPLKMSNLQLSMTLEESIALNKIEGGAIIIAASGMADAGRIKHHLKHNLWRNKSTILFVGYQAQGTLGRRLCDGAKEVTIHGERVAVNAFIKQIDGMSAHADQNELISWLSPLGHKASTIILTHGEPEGIVTFTSIIKDKFNKDPIAPSLGTVLEIDATHILEHPPEQPWLSSSSTAEETDKKDPSPIRSLGKGPYTSNIKNLNSRVNRVYKRLKSNLHRFVDQGKRTDDYEFLLEVLNKLDNWLEEVKGNRKY